MPVGSSSSVVTALHTVIVNPTPINAIIKLVQSIKYFTPIHSTMLLHNRDGNRQCSPGLSLLLDSSGSRDPDTNSATGLSYLWSCSLVPITGDTSGVCSNFPGGSSSTLLLSANTLLAGRQYIFTVVITGNQHRNSSSSVTITMGPSVSSTTPIINVALDSSRPSAALLAANPQANDYVSTNQPVRLIGTISIPQGSISGCYLKYLWSELGGFDIDANRASSLGLPTLVIKAGALMPGNIDHYESFVIH